MENESVLIYAQVAERARNNPLVIIGRYNIEYSSFKEPTYQ